MKTRFITIALGLLLASGCGGGGSSSATPSLPAPVPTATPFTVAAATLGATATSTAIPPAAGYSGNITLPAGSGNVSITTSATAPSGTAVLQSATRKGVLSSANTALLYVSVTATTAASLSGPPSLAVALAAAAPPGPYYLAQYAGGSWRTIAGPVNSSGSTVTFNATGAAISLNAGQSVQIAVYIGGPIYTPATPAPGTIPVASSSYINEKAPNIGPQTLPNIPGANLTARTYADFFQDGTYGLFIATLEYNPSDPSTYSHTGHLHFFHNAGGTWVDQTSKLLSDTTGCLHPRKAIVADFNGDAKPDIFVACHGLDAPPYPGEQPILLLSQPDGTYKKTVLPYTAFMHGASAAVLNRMGYADIVVIDTMIQKTPYFLINNGDGTFHQDLTRLPASLLNKQIFSAELIDLDNVGKYDLLLGGNEPNSQGSPDPYSGVEFATTIYKNPGMNVYDDSHKLVVPSDPAYGGVLDFIYRNSNLYILRVVDQPGSAFYGATEVQKVSYPGMAGSSLYTHTGPFSNGSTWFPWLFNYNSSIISDDASFGISLTP